MYEVGQLCQIFLIKSMSARSRWGKHLVCIRVRLYSLGTASPLSAYDVCIAIAACLPSDKVRSSSLLNEVSFKLFQKALYIGNVSLPKFRLRPELVQACFLHALLCKLIKVSTVTS
jgi:hypothetical protein